MDYSEKDLLSIEITKRDEAHYMIQMTVKSFDFDKNQVLDLIKQQFNKFETIENDNENKEEE